MMCDVLYNRKKLMCVEYPGYVQNVSKMIDTLDGQSSLNKVYSEPSRRLELRFRPQDIHCKCARGDRFDTTSLLMKVKRRRKPRDNNLTDNEQYIVEILGTVDITYKFKGMMDFQYLPMINNKGNYDSVVSSVIPKGLQVSSWLNEPASTFIQPVIFSRLDMPANYYFHRDPVKRTDTNDEKISKTTRTDIIRNRRQIRAGYTIFVNFEDDIPTKPKENAEKHVKAKCGDQVLPGRLKTLFEERPIWSKNGLIAQLNCDNASLKIILPSIAFHYITGPWRSLWVQFGYDPRKSPESKIYQIIDFRVKQCPIEDIQLVPRKGSILTNKVSQTQARISTIQTEQLTQSQWSENALEKNFEEEKDKGYTFRPDRLPACRQNFYQLCDIDIPEVQKAIHSNDNKEKDCLDKCGWLKPGVLEKCREIMIYHMKETMGKLKEKQKPEKHTDELQATEDFEESDPDYVLEESSDDDL